MNIKSNKGIATIAIVVFWLMNYFIAAQEVSDQTDTEVSSIQRTQKKAADGDLESQIFLGAFHENHKNYSESAKWYRKAAEQNDPIGQFRLGELYYAGHGVSKDPIEAYKWIKLSLDQKNENPNPLKSFQPTAEKRIKELELQMTEKQIARANGLISIFLREQAPTSH